MEVAAVEEEVLVTEGDSAEAVEEIEVATVTVVGEVVRPSGKFFFLFLNIHFK